MFVLVRLFDFLLGLGGYADVVKEIYLKVLKTIEGRFIAASLISYLLAFFALAGSGPIAYFLLRNMATQVSLRPKRYLWITISRGFSWADMTSPLSVSVAIAVTLSGVSWINVIPYTFLFSVLGFAISLMVERRFLYKTDKWQSLTMPVDLSGAAMDFPTKKKMVEICGALFVLVAAITTLSSYTSFSTLENITLVCIFTPLLWAVYLKKVPIFLRQVRQFLTQEIVDVREHFILFVATGFIATAFTQAKIGDYIRLAASFLGNVGPGYVIVIIPVFILTLSFLGIHPFATVTVIGKTIDPYMLGLEAPMMGLLLIIGLSSAGITSPFTGMTLFMSSYLSKNPAKVGIEWNGKYILLFLLSMLLVVRLLVA